MTAQVDAVVVDGTPSLKTKVYDITLSSSYATNGEAVTAATFGFTSLVNITPQQTAGYVIEFVPATLKLKVYWQRDSNGTTYDKHVLTEVDNATDLSGVTIRCSVQGRVV